MMSHRGDGLNPNRASRKMPATLVAGGGHNIQKGGEKMSVTDDGYLYRIQETRANDYEKYLLEEFVIDTLLKLRR